MGSIGYNIDNIVKCRPPENRNPTEEEFRTCSEAWLYAQLASAQPKVVVAMGRFAIGFFRRYPWDHITKMGVTKEVQKGRFVWHQPASFQGKHRIIVYPTFHPAYVMRNGEVVRGVIKTFMQAKKCLESLT
jgi:DNA polymerase